MHKTAWTAVVQAMVPLVPAMAPSELAQAATAITLRTRRQGAGEHLPRQLEAAAAAMAERVRQNPEAFTSDVRPLPPGRHSRARAAWRLNADLSII